MLTRMSCQLIIVAQAYSKHYSVKLCMPPPAGALIFDCSTVTRELVYSRHKETVADLKGANRAMRCLSSYAVANMATYSFLKQKAFDDKKIFKNTIY